MDIFPSSPVNLLARQAQLTQLDGEVSGAICCGYGGWGAEIKKKKEASTGLKVSFKSPMTGFR